MGTAVGTPPPPPPKKKKKKKKKKLIVLYPFAPHEGPVSWADFCISAFCGQTAATVLKQSIKGNDFFPIRRTSLEFGHSWKHDNLSESTDRIEREEPLCDLIWQNWSSRLLFLSVSSMSIFRR